jgi:hypothetical protein
MSSQEKYTKLLELNSNLLLKQTITTYEFNRQGIYLTIGLNPKYLITCHTIQMVYRRCSRHQS